MLHKTAPTKTTTFILQWNINGLYAHLPDLQMLIAKHRPPIIALQETRFKKDQLYTLKNYDLYHKTRTSSKIAAGGVALFIHKSFSSHEIIIHSDLEVVAAVINYPTPIAVCNIYIPPNKDISPLELSNILNQIPSPKLLIGDFNAHSPLWGAPFSNTKGKALEHVIETSNLILLNNDQKTRFDSFSGELSTLDLSLCDSSLLHQVECNVLPELHNSDHYPILIQHMHKANSPSGTPIPRWNVAKANWALYAAIIEGKIQETSIEQLPFQAIENLMAIIHEAAELSMGKTSGPSKHVSVPWWNSECQKAVRASKKAFNRLKRHNTLENLLEFKRLRAISRRTLKNSKTKSWRDYVTSVNSRTPPTEVWNKIKSIKGSKTSHKITSLQSENLTAHSNIDIAEMLASHFQKSSANTNYDNRFLPIKRSSESEPLRINLEDQHILNLPITKKELDEALMTTKNSSPGPDGITFLLLRMLPEAAKNALLDAYNELLSSGTFPDIWSTAIIVPILKPNKVKTDPLSYRPISLTCTTCKLLEKILNKRLMWYLEQNHLLLPTQNAFRQSRSSTDNIITLESDIHDAFVENQHVLAIFFDLKKAFDTAWRYAIVTKLQEWGVCGKMLKFIQSFLDNRSFRVAVNGYLSSSMTLENGTPQGSVLSTTLFLVAINDICQNISKPIKNLLFADDLTLYIKGKDIHLTARLMQAALNHIESWSLSHGFTFSTEKTKCIVFSKSKPPNLPAIYLNNCRLPAVEQIKYLGVIFDGRLTWKPHIDFLRKECTKRINLLKVLAHQDWGSDTEMLLKIYRSTIRSLIDYGSVAYSSAKPTVLKPLDTIQNTALRTALSAFHTTPILSLYCVTHEPPLALRRSYLALAYELKTLENPQSSMHHLLTSTRLHRSYDTKKSASPSIHRRIKLLHTDLPFTPPAIYPYLRQLTPPWTHSDIKCNLEMRKVPKNEVPTSVVRSEFAQITDSHPNPLIIFTDAAKSDQGVGCAYVTPTESIKFTLPPECSVLTAELSAIAEALDYALPPHHQYSNLLLCTDSLSALQSLQKPSPSPLALNIKAKAEHLESTGLQVHFIWTPSHAGIDGNEEADRAAKDAIIRQDDTTMRRHLQKRDAQTALKNAISAKWQSLWDTTDTLLHQVIPDVNFNKRGNFPRKDEVAITRLRLGHTKLTHGYILSRTDRPTCHQCKVPLTVPHLLQLCPLYEEHRRKSNLPKSTIEALKPGQEDKLLDFIRYSNLFNEI